MYELNLIFVKYYQDQNNLESGNQETNGKIINL